MSFTAALDLQKATYGVLIADPAVQKLLGIFQPLNVMPLFDKVPDAVVQAYASQASGPTYVTIGDGSETQDVSGDARDADNYEVETRHVLVFHVFSQQVGLTQVKQIVHAMRAAMIGAFAAQALRLPADRLIQFDPVRAEYGRLEDGFTSHGALTMSAKTQPGAPDQARDQRSLP